MKYYLAYGSNLHVAQMRRRCPDAVAVGTAMLTGYRLLYRGSKTGAYLTIEPSVRDRVPVGVWAVSDEDETSLDYYEGFPTFYGKEEVTISVKPMGGGRAKKVKAFFYAMRDDRPLGVPSIRYEQTCKVGYQCFGFDQSYLTKALKFTKGGMRNESKRKEA